MTPAKAPEKAVETVPLDQLTPDPDNARAHGRDNLAAIRASLERFGQVRPLLTTAEGVVVAGNGTLAAMKALGWSEAQIVRLPWKDAATCRAYAIADNRTAELAAWDCGTLTGQLGDLSAAGIPMDGFDFVGGSDPAPAAGDRAAAAAEAGRSYRCPACGFRWRYDDGGEVVPL